MDREEGSRLGVFAVAAVLFFTVFRSLALPLTEEDADLRLIEGDAALAVTFIVLPLEGAGDFVLDVLDERLATAVGVFFVDFPGISGLLFSRNQQCLTSCSGQRQQQLPPVHDAEAANDSSSVISHQGMNRAIFNFLTSLQKPQFNHKRAPDNFCAQFPQ